MPVSRRSFLKALTGAIVPTIAGHLAGSSMSGSSHDLDPWTPSPPGAEGFWRGEFALGEVIGFFDERSCYPLRLCKTIALRAADAGRSVIYCSRSIEDEWWLVGELGRMPEVWYAGTHGELLAAIGSSFAERPSLLIADAGGRADAEPLPLSELREQARRTGASVLVPLSRPEDGQLSRRVDVAWDFGPVAFFDDGEDLDSTLGIFPVLRYGSERAPIFARLYVNERVIIPGRPGDRDRYAGWLAAGFGRQCPQKRPRTSWSFL